MSQGHTHEASGSEQAFRDAMLTGMAQLNTKMNILVGVDGTNGWKSEIDKDIEDLKEERDTRKGLHRGLAVLSNLASGVVGSVITYLLRRH